jgi:CBS domain containing-hemolysin-like protein
LGLVAVVVLTFGTGYFVAAEFAFVAVRRGRLEERAAEGDRWSAQAVEVRRRLGFMLSGAQLGITVATLVVGFIAEPALGQVFEPLLDAAGLPERSRVAVAVVIAFVVVTVGQMVLGELAPKNLAIARPEPVARALAPSVLVFIRVTGPVIRLFDGAANRLLPQ